MPLTQVQGQMLSGSNNTTTTIQSNGTTAITIDSSQNVGVGTTSPTNSANYKTLSLNGTTGGQLAFQSGGTLNGSIYNDASGNFVYSPFGYAAFWTAGAERMRISSTGNVGIGTNAPSSLLHVRQATATGASTTGTNQLFVENNGAVGISLITPTVNQAIIRHSTALDQISASITFDGTGRYMSFSTVNGIERMRINNGGNVGIGITDPTNVRLYIKGEAASSSNWAIYALNSNNVQMFGIRNDNYFYAPSIGNYATGGTALYYDGGGYVGLFSSSLRYKKDIRDYDKGLDAIAALRPVYYKAKNTRADGTVDDSQYAGLIAEEVDAAGFNEFVVYDEEGRPNAVQYQNMIALMTKAIQELKAELDATKAEVAELKAKGQ